MKNGLVSPLGFQVMGAAIVLCGFVAPLLAFLGAAFLGGAVRALGASALPSFTPAVTTLLAILALGHLPTRLELLGMGLATLGLLLAILGPGPRQAGSMTQERTLASREKRLAFTPIAKRIDEHGEAVDFGHSDVDDRQRG